MLCLYPFFWIASFYILGEILHNFLSLPLILALFTLNAIITYSVIKQHKNKYKNINNYPPAYSQKIFTPNIIVITLCTISFLGGGYRYNQEKTTNQKLTCKLAEQKIFSASFKILESKNIPENVKWQTKAKLLSINKNLLPNPVVVMLSGRNKTTLEYNDTLYADRVLYLPDKIKKYPEDFSYSEYMHTKGINARLLILGNFTITANKNFSLFKSLNKLRNMLINNIQTYSTPATAGFLNASLLGYRQDLSSSLKNNFKKTGISHIIAISGLHLSLIVLLSWYICSSLNFNKRYTALISITACLLFLTLSGIRPSVLRASIVAIIYLSGILLYRQSNFINSIGAAALLICIQQPQQIYDIGLQLSFTSVIFISNIMQETPQLIQSLKPEFKLKLNLWQYYLKAIPHRIILLMVVTASAWLGVLPITSYYFHQVSLIAFISNIVIVPLMTLSLIGGMLLQLCPLLPDSITTYYSQICSAPAELIIWLSSQFCKLPITTLQLFPPSKLLIFFYYLAFASLFLTYAVNRLKHHRLRLIILIIITSLTIGLIYQGRKENLANSPEIILLENREAETAILRNKNYNIIITSAQADYRTIVNYLYQNHIRTVDKLYLTGNNNNAEQEYKRVLNIKTIKNIAPKTREGSKIIYPFKNRNISITLSRNKNGRILWYYFCNYNISVLTSSWHNKVQLNKLMQKSITGSTAKIKFLRITKNRDLKLKKEKNELIFRYKNNMFFPNRRDYGIIKISEDKITAWDGKNYKQIK